jgi:hypothetical protein
MSTIARGELEKMVSLTSGFSHFWPLSHSSTENKAFLSAFFQRANGEFSELSLEDGEECTPRDPFWNRKNRHSLGLGRWFPSSTTSITTMKFGRVVHEKQTVQKVLLVPPPPL